MIIQIRSRQPKMDSQPYNGPVARSIELLLLQPTPFCNINCDYCYLPSKEETHRMSLEVVKGALRLVMEGGLVDHRLSIVWHGGEPLVLPVSYYEEAFEAIAGLVQQKFEVAHSFQTNGTRIDEAWCDFLETHNARIGLSLDGPAFLHDKHRKTRQGKPTHAAAMVGVEKLKAHNIPFHVIAVISNDSLDHVEEFFNFFQELGPTELGLNVEELEGRHRTSSMNSDQALDRLETFWQQLFNIYESSNGSFRIREFHRAADAIRAARIGEPWQDTARHNDQVLPFRIISVGHQGNISSFSPELVGMRDTEFNSFTFGKIGQDNLSAVFKSQHFSHMATEVMRGVERCSETCEYFSVCGGGAPSNKYFENGNFSSTTTMHCRASIQLPVKVVLSALEKSLVAPT